LLCRTAEEESGEEENVSECSKGEDDPEVKKEMVVESVAVCAGVCWKKRRELKERNHASG